MKTKNVVIAGLVMCVAVSIGSGVIYAVSYTGDYFKVNTNNPPALNDNDMELTRYNLHMTDQTDTFDLRTGDDDIKMGDGSDDLFMGNNNDLISMGSGSDTFTFFGGGTDVNYLAFASSATPPTGSSTGTWLKHDNAFDDLEIRVSSGKLIIRLGD